MKNVAIIGAGLAGLISSIELVKKGVPCTLFEKKKFPFHRVCGEYISNEALPYLKKQDLFPAPFLPSTITDLVLTSVRGQTATMPLDLGGFGVSRFSFDNFLLNKAKSLGVMVNENMEVTEVRKVDDSFVIKTEDQEFIADLVIGSFGKRSRLDLQLKRDFTTKRSPYIGVKYHVRSPHPANVIALHNFKGGYCGVVAIENYITNICYLARRSTLQQCGTIERMEKEILCTNPALREVFNNATHLWDKPQVINEISFATKSPVEKHILMAGDSAGMITPLCGNGMAIAIHSAKMLSELVTLFCNDSITRNELEQRYTAWWRALFENRLRVGRTVQKLFGNSFLSDMSVSLIVYSKFLAQRIMRNTHGQEF